MQLAAKLRNQVSSFTKDRSGNIFMVTALSIFAIMGSAGAAIDYSRIYTTKSKMEQALDSAVLATGVSLTKGETNQDKLRAQFDAFFNINVEGSGNHAEEYRVSSFSANPTSGEVKAEVVAIVDPTLMAIFGYEEFEVGAESTAVFDQTDVEVAMMLDVTGSMEGQKIRDLRAAATEAVDILIKDNSDDVRISLVPYSGSVNVGRNIANKVTAGNRTVAALGEETLITDVHAPFRSSDRGCVTERGGRNAATDTSYDQSPLGSDVRARNENIFRCPRLSTVVPLTANKNTLTNEIRRMSPAGTTAGHLGIAWSYYTLSENWADTNIWPRESHPAPYESETQKYAILMTDGMFNTFYHGTTASGNGSAYGHPDKSNDLASRLCENMKGSGITIYSIGFDLGGIRDRGQRQEVIELLQQCANENTADSTFFFNADNGDQLRAAFRAIATDISRLRISQ
ncbi:MAG: pilus assembly protein [Pseudomonadota bacterium]